MKKYTEEHLEKTPPEIVIAFERTIVDLSNKDCGSESCPAVKIRADLMYPCNEEVGWICPTYLMYRANPVCPCPCWRFGPDISMRMMAGLVEQWKKWAGIE